MPFLYREAMIIFIQPVSAGQIKVCASQRGSVANKSVLKKNEFVSEWLILDLVTVCSK